MDKNCEKVLNKIINRMEQSEWFEPSWSFSGVRQIRTYLFDDGLHIDSYNGIYRVRFKGETIEHYHDNDQRSRITNVIRKREDEAREKAISQL